LSAQGRKTLTATTPDTGKKTGLVEPRVFSVGLPAGQF
jgi:hypothetical protein